MRKECVRLALLATFGASKFCHRCHPLQSRARNKITTPPPPRAQAALARSKGWRTLASVSPDPGTSGVVYDHARQRRDTEIVVHGLHNDLGLIRFGGHRWKAGQRVLDQPPIGGQFSVRNSDDCYRKLSRTCTFTASRPITKWCMGTIVRTTDGKGSGAMVELVDRNVSRAPGGGREAT